MAYLVPLLLLLLFLHFNILFPDQRAGNDPAFKIAEKFSTLPRQNVYSEAVKMFATYVTRKKEYGYADGSPEDSWFRE